MKNTSNNSATERLIFALDAATYTDALQWVELLSGHVGMFKVGKELFTAVGPDIIFAIKEKNKKYFWISNFMTFPIPSPGLRKRQFIWEWIC